MAKSAIFYTGKYFDEISQDTGRYCFGVTDTLKSLEMGAVEILIVWENLEVTRYVLKDHSTDSKYHYCCYKPIFITLQCYRTIIHK